MKTELLRIKNNLQDTPEDSPVEELNRVIDEAIVALEGLINKED